MTIMNVDVVKSKMDFNLQMFSSLVSKTEMHKQINKLKSKESFPVLGFFGAFSFFSSRGLFVSVFSEVASILVG